MKIGIIGYGHVGRSMNKEFKDAIIYDEPLNMGSREEINECDVAFIAVPTPKSDDGTCDTSIVEDVLSWVEAKVLVIRSTVYIGFTDWASEKYNKKIVFQPEYYGETVSHPFANPNFKQWLSFGGKTEDIEIVIDAYKTIKNSTTKILQAPAKEVELAKYMENVYFATKVTFVNEMYDIAKAMGISYDQAREIWLADPRIGDYHTFVFKDNRGFGGKCLPKDLASLVSQGKEIGVNVDLIESVQNKNNNIYSKMNKPNSQELYNEKVDF